MNFRAEFNPKPFPIKLKHTDKLLLIGSCFTEQIGKKLEAHKFNLIQNPNGILFNPFSISKSIMGYAKGKVFKENELFYYNELWASRDHHTSFSDPDAHVALEKINSSQQAAASFIQHADWILITLGSAWVYEWNDIKADEQYSQVAANCHKIPTDKFNRRLAGSEEISIELRQMQVAVKNVNPNAKFIYTISPVRHLREGFIENNRSKAALIQAVHSLTNETDAFYFPAYELIIDDLRDYRFFAEDLVHPNYTATNYVWEKFKTSGIEVEAVEIMAAINEINAAINHKPFNPTSVSHQKFVVTIISRIQILSRQYSYLDFSGELAFFNT